MRIVSRMFRGWHRFVEETRVASKIRREFRCRLKAARSRDERRQIKANRREAIASALSRIERKYNVGSPYDV
jgi:hypothetical protein